MVKNTEKSTSGCWPGNVSDSEDSSPEECLLFCESASESVEAEQKYINNSDEI